MKKILIPKSSGVVLPGDRTFTQNRSMEVIESITVFVVIVAAIKFLFQGGSINFFGSADAATYGMFLTPVLGAHGWLKSRKSSKGAEKNVDEK